MARYCALLLLLGSFMVFLAVYPPEGVRSQSNRLSSPAVNALAVEAASSDYNFKCPVETAGEIDAAVRSDPSNSSLYIDRLNCRNFFAANTSVTDYTRALARIRSDNLSDVEKAISLDPKNARAYFLRARMAAQSLEFADSTTAKLAIPRILSDLARTIELEPGNSEALYYRAVFRFYEMDDKKGAIDDLTSAIAIDNDKPLFIQKRAELSAEMEDWPGAIKDYSTLIKLDPDDASALLFRARVYRKSGENAKALEDLNLTLKKAKYFEAEVLEERSLVYRSLGNTKAALADERRLRVLRRR